MASRSKQYYDKNPESRKKKAEYDRAYHSTPERKAYKRALSRANRATNGWGDGKDVSHTSSGHTTKESPSKNRARNGANGRSTKKRG